MSKNLIFAKNGQKLKNCPFWTNKRTDEQTNERESIGLSGLSLETKTSNTKIDITFALNHIQAHTENPKKKIWVLIIS